MAEQIKGRKHKIIAFAVTATIAVLAIITLQPLAVGNEVFLTETEPVYLISEPEQFLESGGRAVILLNSNDQIEVARGNEATVQISLTYLAGTNPYDVLTLVPKGTGQTIIPASIAKTQTIEERFTAIKEGLPIPNGIPIDQFLLFSKEPITLKPGETKTLTVTVQIPQNINNELVNDVIQLPMKFDTIEETGNTVWAFSKTVPNVKVI